MKAELTGMAIATVGTGIALDELTGIALLTGAGIARALAPGRAP